MQGCPTLQCPPGPFSFVSIPVVRKRGTDRFFVAAVSSVRVGRAGEGHSRGLQELEKSEGSTGGVLQAKGKLDPGERSSPLATALVSPFGSRSPDVEPDSVRHVVSTLVGTGNHVNFELPLSATLPRPKALRLSPLLRSIRGMRSLQKDRDAPHLAAQNSALHC